MCRSITNYLDRRAESEILPAFLSMECFGTEEKMNRKKTILVFVIKCICIPAAAVLILFLLNIPYREIDDAKYMDMWNLRMLGNQINEVEIANVGRDRKSVV